MQRRADAAGQLNSMLCSFNSALCAGLSRACYNREPKTEYSSSRLFKGGQYTIMSEAHYDVAQICTNGHVITTSAGSGPELRQTFCSECGKPTLMACTSCDAPIRGYYYVPGVIGFSEHYIRPSFCHNCGKPYPWTTARLEAASELLIETANLNDDEQKTLTQNLNEITTDNPRTQLAATRIRRFVQNAGSQVAGAIRDILVDVASEAAKKILWP